MAFLQQLRVSLAPSPVSKLKRHPFSNNIIYGSYKLNTSGARGKKQGAAVYGGILRDERGCWMRGFMGHLGTGSSHDEAETWAIFKGVELVDGLRLQNVTLEAHSLAFSVLEQPHLYTDSSSFKELVSNYQKLIKKNQISLRSITIEENTCACFLAKLAMDDDDEYTDVLDPPPAIEDLILADQDYKSNISLD